MVNGHEHACDNILLQYLIIDKHPTTITAVMEKMECVAEFLDGRLSELASILACCQYFGLKKFELN